MSGSRKKNSPRPIQASSKPSREVDTIYFVPHTHYDAIWVFTKEDYFYINIDLILKKAVELIEKSDFKFLIEQTYLLEEIERRDPLLFGKIEKFIKEGKIEIADGEYLMADTMLSKGETLIREILFGKNYVKEKFGKEVLVMWQADSFGLNAQLPQIYKKSGYRYIAFRRGVNKDRPSEFWWQGLDGTKILSHWMPRGYRAGLDLSKLEQTYKILKSAAVTSNILMPCGSGVTVPQPETSKAVKEWNRTHRKSKIKISTSAEFFENLEKEAKNLRTRKGEFYSGRFSEVFPHCSSSRMWIKLGLRKYENQILSSERWATIDWLLTNLYPQSEISECWKWVLFAAFHDVIPGTGMDQSYQELKQGFSFLRTHLSILHKKSLLNICKKLELKGDIVVFNPLPFPVKNWVESELKFSPGKVKKIEGLKSEKEEIEIEILEFTRYEDESLERVKIGFVADTPAFGYKIYQILEKKPKTSAKKRIKIVGNTIENQFFKVKIDPSTGLIDIFKNGNWLAKGNELVLEEEIGDLYYHRHKLDTPLKTEGGEGIKYGKFKIKNFRISKSSLRRTIDIEEDYYSLRWPYRLTEKFKPLIWRHKFVSVVKKIIIYKDLPRIDFITQIKNRHPQIRIRLKFSTDINSLAYNCESQFGVVQRPVNQYYSNPKNWKEKPCGVYPSLNWIDYSDKEKGLTIINEGIPANEIRNGNIYLTLLRSVLMLSSDGSAGPAIPVPDAAELKDYRFSYSALPHSKDWKSADSFKSGLECNYKLASFQLSTKKSPKLKEAGPWQFSFLEIKPENIILTAFKKAEHSDEVILRLFETKEKTTQAEINLFREPEKVKEVNLLEEDVSSSRIEVKDKKIRLKVKPFEIVTLKIKF